MFSFNEALSSIVAAESDVVAVYRSAASVMAAPEGRREQPCDAFICIVNEEGGERIYVAIQLRSDKETLVYTAASTAGITNATSFLERFGFRMENCNLGFSTALREVIIRSIGVISPPVGDRPLSSGRPGGIQLPPAEKPAAAAPAQFAPRGEVPGEAIRKLQAEWEKVLGEREGILDGVRAQHAEELARLTAERSSREEAAAAELAAAKAELASLSEDFEALRAEYQLINEELTTRNDDLNRLRDEMQEAERKAAAAKEALAAELQRAREAKDAAERSAAAELAQLKATVERLSAGGASATAAASGASAIDKAVADLAGLSAQSVELFPAASTAAGDGGELIFRLDRNITAVTYGAGDDIIEIHASINAAQMNPPGGKAESSLAWVCGIERNGSPQIYIAFYLNESGQALIHVPDRQPSSLAAYGRGIRSAIAYVETIGFMMEALPIGTAAERSKILQGIPVFEL